MCFCSPWLLSGRARSPVRFRRSRALGSQTTREFEFEDRDALAEAGGGAFKGAVGERRVASHGTPVEQLVCGDESISWNDSYRVAKEA